MTGPIARIIARYGSGVLVTWGVMSPELGDSLAYDPDVIALVGFAVGAAAEFYYWMAKRYGDPT
jgi:hypothetical protein